MTREDPVLAPGAYTLSVLAGARTEGRDPGFAWEPQQNSAFTVGPPPGLPTPTGTIEGNRHYPAGGPLADLSVYVRTTVPAAGERPAYRAYDVGVEFTEPYVSRMFLAASAGLTVAVTDPNGIDRRSGAPNVWGRGPEVRLGEQETRFVKTLNGDGSSLCAPVDLTTLVRDEGISAGAGELLAPSTQHVAALRTVDGRTAYRFAFTTSRFADFRHHLARADGRARRRDAVGVGTPVDLTAALSTVDAATAAYAAARTAATTGTPTAAQLDAYPVAALALANARAALAATRAAGFATLWEAAFAGPPADPLPEGVEITHVPQLSALLLESAEPLAWERIVPALDVATVTPLRARTLGAAGQSLISGHSAGTA